MGGSTYSVSSYGWVNLFNLHSPPHRQLHGHEAHGLLGRHQHGLGVRSGGSRGNVSGHGVALQVAFERQTLKPVFRLIGYRLWV
jgi:hypothetical protein